MGTATHHPAARRHDVRLLRAAVRVLPVACAVADASGALLVSNDEAVRVAGLGGPGAPLESWPAVFGLFRVDAEVQLPFEELPIVRAMAGEEQDDVEIYVQNALVPDGRWVAWTVRPFDQGTYVVALRDVTRRRRAIQALAASEERLARIVANTPGVSIQTFDLDGRVLSWNPASERIFGWSAREALGKKLDELLFDAPTEARFEAALRQADRSGVGCAPCEWPCRCKDGSHAVVVSTVFGIPAIGGGREIVCMDVDVTALRAAEEAASRRAERLDALARISRAFGEARLEIEPLVIRVVDALATSMRAGATLALLADDGERLELRGVRLPPGWEEPRAAGREAATGRPARDALWERAIAARGAVVIDAAAVAELCPAGAPPGAPAATRAILAPLVVPGRLVGAVAVFDLASPATEEDAQFVQEVADRAALALDNARLFRATADALHVREDFLSVASHELRTPLTPLQLQIQVLARDIAREVAPPVAGGLEARIVVIERQVRRLTTLVDHLLDISRITSGRLELERAPVDLGALVREVAERFGEELAASRSELRLDVAERIVGSWDRLRIDQVVTNLLTNAIKYGRGQPIDVVVSGDARTARLVVRDRGIGVAPADQARIFARFERAVPEVHYGGLGLGLWIVRQIIEAHAGRVQVESVPGEGATFTIELPRVEPADVAR